MFYTWSYTGSSRKNDKSKSRSRGVYFYKILIFTPVPGRKIATNYSPTPSRSPKKVLWLPEKVAHPMLDVWKSGSRSSKSWSWQLLLRPQWTQRVHILGETHFVFHLRKSTVLTTFLIIGQVKDHFLAFLRPLLSSKSLIFTQPAFEAQPLREASKHFWETWMEWGSNSLLCKKNLRGIQGCYMKADVRPVLKMWYIFFTPHNFDDKLKFSDSVDFEQP